jgi:hypothetical protein
MKWTVLVPIVVFAAVASLVKVSAASTEGQIENHAEALIQWLRSEGGFFSDKI